MNQDDNRVILISVDDIIPNRFQPRLKFNEKELQSLAESISEHGIVSPIIVRQIGEKYEIIAGERRFKAANLIGLKSVPCIVKNLDDTESAEVAVIENLQRANLTPIEEARSYDKLLAKGMTQDQLAKRLGVSQPTIANKIRLLNLSPQVQDILLQNKISERHARSLLQLPNFTMQNEMCDKIIENRLTVRQTDEEIAKVLGKNVTKDTEEETDASAEGLTMEISPEVDNLPIVDAPNVHFEELLRKDLPLPSKEEKVNVEESSEFNDIPELIDIDAKTKEEINPFQAFTTPKEETLNPFANIVNKEEAPVTFSVEPEVKKGPTYVETPMFEPNPINETKKVEEKVEPKSNKLSIAIDDVRNIQKSLTQKGYNIDTEEFDFEDMYQIVIKIKKN